MLANIEIIFGICLAAIAVLGYIAKLWKGYVNSEVQDAQRDSQIDNKIKELEEKLSHRVSEIDSIKRELEKFEENINKNTALYTNLHQIVLTLQESQKEAEGDYKEMLKLISLRSL